jgi:hypothetical protein
MVDLPELPGLKTHENRLPLPPGAAQGHKQARCRYPKTGCKAALSPLHQWPEMCSGRSGDGGHHIWKPVFQRTSRKKLTIVSNELPGFTIDVVARSPNILPGAPEPFFQTCGLKTPYGMCTIRENGDNILLMANVARLRRQINNSLKRPGFEKYGFLWRNESNAWVQVVDVRMGKFKETQQFPEMDIGFFPPRIDEIPGSGKAAGFDGSLKVIPPTGTLHCHFETSLFQLSATGKWIEGAPRTMFFKKGEPDESFIQKIVEMLDQTIPLAYQHYANTESIVQCYLHKIGAFAKSGQKGIYAAAASYELGNLKEAQNILDDNIRAGSIQLMKDAAARLSKLIDSA